ncbi:MAG: DUF3368 domain-containing protein [Candidatus Thiothrix moscowensis]|nr:DUF3368 domain-containing protein [Candidatus Thiothrix moscowensis]
MIIVADASPLVALAICDCLDVLEQLFNEVKVSQTVYEEVTIGNKPGSDKLTAYLQGKIVGLNLDNYIIGGDSLDKGELTSIALYKHLQADYLLIDEKAGRKVAKLNHVKIIGSLGVLIEAKRKGIIPSLKPHVEILRLSKAHFSDDLLDYALAAVGE